ncbi:MAG: YceI family protein [Ignavibacteriales bacterium]|nr:YceI family protein [Ignavibacteriales bacterium]
MKSVRMFFVLLALVSGFSLAQSNWKIDASHSNIIFTVQHLVISEVSGYFKEFEGTVTSKKDDDFSDAVINFTAKTKSINTDNDKRDEHLRSDDFFNTEKFPAMTFVSKSFKKVKGNKYKLVGDLTIRDITKEVKLDVVYSGTVKDPWGNTKSGFKLSGSINRIDFGLKWNALMEAGGTVVGKDVKITCNLELGKQK